VGDPAPEREAREQHNHGSGPFIAGNNHGGIHFEMVDTKTKTLLTKMTKQSPTLARLLTRALNDGVISPDTAGSLARAARSINEDVAGQLGRAARNINEDVASQLGEAARNINQEVARSLTGAGENINPTVAKKLADAAKSLSETVNQLDFDHLRRLADRFDGVQGALTEATTRMDRLQSGGPFSRMGHITDALDSAAQRMEHLVTPPPPKIIIDRKAQWYSFLWGAGAGAALVAYLLGR
jgi:hypothetical protein